MNRDVEHTSGWALNLETISAMFEVTADIKHLAKHSTTSSLSMRVLLLL